MAAIRKIKKLSGQTTVTTINSNQKFPLTDANGKVTLIALADLKAALLSGMNLNSMYDGVFIMCHRKSDDYPIMYKTEDWTAQQNAGEIADGVVIVEGGKVLVVAPTESANSLKWSSAAVSCGGTSTGDRLTAFNDWNGKTNTAKAIAASSATAVTNTAEYAPGYCNLYARKNANGKGLTAGKWWLPSVAELMMMYANFNKINYAISLIKGGEPLQKSWYWTSTENGASCAWYLGVGYGYVTPWDGKATCKIRVRAVSAFIS